jgi:hypothetical protein
MSTTVVASNLSSTCAEPEFSSRSSRTSISCPAGIAVERRVVDGRSELSRDVPGPGGGGLGRFDEDEDEGEDDDHPGRA